MAEALRRIEEKKAQQGPADPPAPEPSAGDEGATRSVAERRTAFADAGFVLFQPLNWILSSDPYAISSKSEALTPDPKP